VRKDKKRRQKETEEADDESKTTGNESTGNEELRQGRSEKKSRTSGAELFSCEQSSLISLNRVSFRVSRVIRVD
jgi:hypothetical protein